MSRAGLLAAEWFGEAEERFCDGGVTDGGVTTGPDLEDVVAIDGDTKGDLTGIWGDGGIFPPKCLVSFM
jgi:hypothetical protein